MTTFDKKYHEECAGGKFGFISKECLTFLKKHKATIKKMCVDTMKKHNGDLYGWTHIIMRDISCSTIKQFYVCSEIHWEIYQWICKHKDVFGDCADFALSHIETPSYENFYGANEEMVKGLCDCLFGIDEDGELRFYDFNKSLITH